MLRRCLVSGALAAEPIKIAQVVDLTGALEAYAKQSVNGFQLGLEYATKGTMTGPGPSDCRVIIKDTQAKPDVGKQMLTEAFKDDKVDLAVGGVFLGGGAWPCCRWPRSSKRF